MPTSLEASFETAKAAHKAAAAASVEEANPPVDHPASTERSQVDADAEANANPKSTSTLASTGNGGAIPAVAALDSSLAPYLNEIALKKQYIAVRVGYASGRPSVGRDCAGSGDAGRGSAAAERGVTAVRNAIFLSWEDARHFVDFAGSSGAGGRAGAERGAITVPYHSNVEWRAFDSMERAEAYLRKVMNPSSITLTAPPAQKGKLKPIKKTKKKSKHTIKPRNRGPPTKKWREMYNLAKIYKETHNSLDVPNDAQNATLYKWIKYQRDSYRMYLEDAVGGMHSMTSEKVELLSDLGFGWVASDKKKMLENSLLQKRGRPRKLREEDNIGLKWMAMFEKLKAYVGEYGTTVIPKETQSEELIALRMWCSQQKSRYVALQKGSANGMTTKKISLLKSIGFVFPPDWNAMYSRLVAFKKEHGHVSLTEGQDSSLAQWVGRQNEVLGRHMQGKSTRLNDEQVRKLLSLGLVGGKRVTEDGGERDERWTEMLLKLRDYKAEHGHCNVPTSLCTDLSNWVAAQRRMYNNLVSGKPGKRAVLDAVKMQRLTELGFQWRPRGSYLSWEDQIEKLQKFKEENGHCKVPVSHPVLGSFVKLARREYKLKQQGQKSSMTIDRENDLREIGFVFEGGKTPQRKEATNKSWDERFEELLRFKEENGHTVVPQNSGRLGQWVHSQRVNYKKFKDGKQTSMTAEKALKLTEIGFCFNAADRFRGNKQEEKPPLEQHYPMYHPDVPQLPPHLNMY